MLCSQATVASHPPSCYGRSTVSSIGFIGAGNMGFALAGCLQSRGLAEHISVYDKLDERCALFGRELRGVTVAADAAAACRGTDACFLAVKPPPAGCMTVTR